MLIVEDSINAQHLHISRRAGARYITIPSLGSSQTREMTVLGVAPEIGLQVG